MKSFQSEKQVVLDYYATLQAASVEHTPAVMSDFLASDCLWRGFHPFHEQTGPEAIATAFWCPLKAAMPHLQRRMDIFIAGQNEIDGD